MDGITLPADLGRFADEAVAVGRYLSLDELIAYGMGVLQRQERARVALLAAVLAAWRGGESSGYLTGDDLLARVEFRLARREAATE
jgi:Arc/MetJ-type ribon-helix-helix transcriptional regulator